MDGQELSPILKDALAKGRLSIDCLGASARLFKGTDEELRALCHVESLKELDLDVENFSDAGLADVGMLKNLYVLKIGGKNFTPAALEPLIHLPHFQELHYRAENTGLAAQTISRLKHLKILDISGKFSDEDIQLICTNKGLESLSLEQCPNLTDQAFRDVGNLADLETLIVPRNKSIGDKSCENIAKCVALRKLSIGGTNISNRGVEKLLALRKLDKLSLFSTGITAKSIDRLSEFPKLRDLSIADNNNLGDEIVPLIKKCKSLDSLLCVAIKLSPEAQKEIAMSRKWKSLWLPNWPEEPEEDEDDDE